MGTWGEGVLDNDGVLDGLADLLDAEFGHLEDGPEELAVGVGVLTLLGELAHETQLARVQSILNANIEALPSLPEATAAELGRLRQEGATVAKLPGSRGADAKAVLGNYCNGPLIEPLFAVGDGGRAMSALQERIMAALDEAHGEDLYELSNELAPLAVLVGLATLGHHVPSNRVDEWRHRFRAADEATTDERDFFDEYAARVYRAFDLVAVPT